MIANSCLVNFFPQKDLIKWSFSTVTTTDLFGDAGGFLLWLLSIEVINFFGIDM